MKMKILAGDLPVRTATLGFKGFMFEHTYPKLILPTSEFLSVEMATEENVKKASGAVGWGTVGALALGPVGLLAGLMLGGNKKEVTFILTLQDGRKALVRADSKTYQRLVQITFNRQPTGPRTLSDE